MFGGLAFMVDGKMCVTVGRNRIMCRIHPAAHDAALKRTGCRAMVMNGRVYRGYVHIDADAVATTRQLHYWIDPALDYNGRAKASPRRQR